MCGEGEGEENVPGSRQIYCIVFISILIPAFILATVSLLVVQHNSSRASLHYQVVVITHPHLCGVYLHRCPQVLVAEQEKATGFDQWNTAALLTVSKQT